MPPQLAIIRESVVAGRLPCTVVRHLLLLRGTSNFHFLPIHPVFGNGDNRGDGSGCYAYFHFFFHYSADLAKHPAGQLRSPPSSCLPSSSAPSPPPGSRGGRPVSAGPIGKQRPKMNFPVSSPSLTSKHSNRSRKNTMRPQFFLMMNSIAAVLRPPPRKFDNFQNL